MRDSLKVVLYSILQEPKQIFFSKFLECAKEMAFDVFWLSYPSERRTVSSSDSAARRL